MKGYLRRIGSRVRTLARALAENVALKQQLAAVGAELAAERGTTRRLAAQLAAIGGELAAPGVSSPRPAAQPSGDERPRALGATAAAEGKRSRLQIESDARQIESDALRAQLASIGVENAGLRTLYDAAHKQYAEAAHKAGLAEVQLRAQTYHASRLGFQVKALHRELFGPPTPSAIPQKTMPPELVDRYSMNGKAELIDAYADWTYPNNHPAIYTDFEIDAYMGVIAGNLAKPREARDWYVYGTLDEWMCEAIVAHPIQGKTVVNMGSMTPWYESMCLYFGGAPVTVDYNTILVRTNRIRVMTIEEWDRERPRFDIGFSISSFEHDGLGAYGDPIDPDADLEAMRKMKERIVPGGLLFLAVPTGRDQVRWNTARVYGRHRLPLLMRGWEWLDSYGYSDADLEGDGSAQPLYILRNTY